MVEWDKVLSWQAEMTDTIDREEFELRAFQSIQKLLQYQRQKAFEDDRRRDLASIDTYLIQVNIMLNLKTMIIQNLKMHYRKTMEQWT